MNSCSTSLNSSLPERVIRTDKFLLLPIYRIFLISEDSRSSTKRLTKKRLAPQISSETAKKNLRNRMIDSRPLS
ncbi:hypothetical protein D3C73_1360980 [compost metagenome]